MNKTKVASFLLASTTIATSPVYNISTLGYPIAIVLVPLDKDTRVASTSTWLWQLLQYIFVLSKWGEYKQWNGLLEWNTGLYYWTAFLDHNTMFYMVFVHIQKFMYKRWQFVCCNRVETFLPNKIVFLWCLRYLYKKCTI